MTTSILFSVERLSATIIVFLLLQDCNEIQENNKLFSSTGRSSRAPWVLVSCCGGCGRLRRLQDEREGLYIAEPHREGKKQSDIEIKYRSIVTGLLPGRDIGRAYLKRIRLEVQSLFDKFLFRKISSVFLHHCS